MHVQNVIEVNASPETMWAVTIDVESLPALSPTFTSVDQLGEGPLRIGSEVRIEQPGLRPAIWTVSRFDEPSVFEWWTKLGPVTLTARHHIEALPDGCRNTLSVTFSGLGAPILGLLGGRKMRRSLATENQGLKTAAEGG